MFDIDPPSPVLHLSAPRKAQQPTLATDAQHLARLERFERGDGGTVFQQHSRDALVFRCSGAVERIRSLSQSDEAFARHIDTL